METVSKHFRLTDETIVWEGRTLHRIEATTDTYWAKEGQKGGWLERESNISGDSEAWVADEGKVCGLNTVLHGLSIVRGNACVFDGATLWQRAIVQGNARVYNSACLYGSMIVEEDASISGLITSIYGNPYIGRGALIKRPEDYLLFNDYIGSQVTAYRTKDSYMIVFGRTRSDIHYYETPREFVRELSRILCDYPKSVREVELLAELIQFRFEE